MSYGYQASTLLWSAEPTFGFIPSRKSFNDSNTADAVSPERREPASLGSTQPSPWGVSDLLRVAGGKTSTRAAELSRPPDLDERAPLQREHRRKDLATPRVTRQTGPWDKYVRWTVALLRQTSPTGTRA